MWELDCEESWVPKSWCFWTVVLEKTLESPLDCKEIQPVHHIGDQSWVFTGRTDAEAETPILWPPDVKSWLIWKDSDAGRDSDVKSWLIWKDSDAGEEGDSRRWDGWMASPTQWIWVWVDSSSWWWTGRPGVLQFMASQRVRHDWVTELNWTDLWFINVIVKYLFVRHCSMTRLSPYQALCVAGTIILELPHQWWYGIQGIPFSHSVCRNKMYKSSELSWEKGMNPKESKLL